MSYWFEDDNIIFWDKIYRQKHTFSHFNETIKMKIKY
jgi:hypothetical protein